MKNVQPDTMAMVITQEHEIISHEKAFVKMEAGCVWVYLLENDKRVGVAYAGPSRFAVDAIAETDMGAMGESVIGSLDGIQLFIGPSSLENISKSAESSDLQNQGFQDIGAFTENIEVTIKDHWNGDDKKTTIDSLALVTLC